MIISLFLDNYIRWLVCVFVIIMFIPSSMFPSWLFELVELVVGLAVCAASIGLFCVIGLCLLPYRIACVSA